MILIEKEYFCLEFFNIKILDELRQERYTDTVFGRLTLICRFSGISIFLCDVSSQYQT